ncbi:MAG: hypothetical protein ACRDBI_14650 [Shewanella sp.]
MSQLRNTFFFMNGDLDNSIAIDVTHDGDHYISHDRDMPDSYSCGMFFVEFFEDKEMKVPVTPRAGKIIPTASLLGDQWFRPNNGDFIDATLVGHGEADYTPLYFNGPFTTAKVAVEGIQGANYMRAYVWRS